ncbi:MAG: hypothetical protein HY093_01490 [Candidatus Liptonbacteria bacterium]|nr:hypothetical protein [Candidatus Liptonbacteria bacterium]
MDLLDLLKEFKKIEPDPLYSRRSKMEILSGPEKAPRLSAWQWLWPTVRFSTASMITLTVILIIFVGFSVIRFSPSLPLRVLDPLTLGVEAQAIDIQIKLTSLDYKTQLDLINQTTTATYAKINELKTNKKLPEVSPKKVGQETVKTDSSTGAKEGSEAMTIDQVLEKISE